MHNDQEIIAAARAGFLEEARDNLAQFEQALLAVEQDPSDAESLNTAFRAAHTIKGTAGLFGYDAVVAFTHVAESVLDLMREGTLAADPDAIARLLQARDLIEGLLDEVGSDTPDPGLAAQCAAHAEALGALAGSGRDAAPAAEAADRTAAADADAAAPPAGVWHLSLEMGRDALRNGLDPISFLRYLDTVGEVCGTRCIDARVPALAALDPEDCLLGFEVRLRSAGPRQAIVDVFDFLVDDCDLVVLGPDATPADYEQLLQRRAPEPAARERLLAHWQALAGPEAPPFIERREAAAPDRRAQEPDRRRGKSDRRAGGDETRFIRVRADKLDRLIDLIGELVIASSGAQLVAAAEQSPRFTEACTRIHDIVQEARDGALGLRMVPVGETFSRFQRVVRDVCVQLGKEVELQVTGGDTELDKSMVDVIADPLMHLVRNSLDHGLETPAERLAAGKPAQGRLALNAYHESGSVVIEVSDDGRGLDRARIRAKAVQRGLIEADAVLDDAEIDALVFEPGFSTAEQVTNLSGRGVGMDVVKRNVESLRGRIKIASQPGRGATIQIRLPLTLAIIDGFLTSVGGVSYVLPLECVAECLELPPECRDEPDRIAGHFDLRGEVLPYLDVGRFYGLAPAPGRRSLVVVKDGPGRIGLLVDRLLGEHQTVIKPLGRVFSSLRGLAGSTILGSGEVALILDVPVLLELATDRPSGVAPTPAFH